MADSEGLDRFCGDQFWDELNSTRIPSFSPCFHYTVLVWAPTIFFWILAPIFVAQIVNYRHKRRFYPLPFSWLVAVKLGLTLLSLLSALLTFFAYFNNKSAAEVYFWYPILRVVTMAGILFAQWNAKNSGIVSSGILFNTFLVHWICAFPEAYAWFQRNFGDHDAFTALHNGYRCFLFFLWFTSLGIQTLVHCWADWRAEADRPKSTFEQKCTPELEASFLSRITLWWFNELPILGSKKNLTQEDLFDLTKEMKSDSLVNHFYSYWKPKMEKYNEMKRQLILEGSSTKLLNGHSKNGGLNEKLDKDDPKKKKEEDKSLVEQPSVIYTLFQMFKYEFWAAAGIKAIADVLQFANPYLLQQLISFVSNPNGHLWQGVTYALLMFGASELRSLLVNWYFYIMFRMGLKIQTTLTGAVYQKTLRLSSTARRDRTVGEIVNVMAIDCDRFMMVTSQIQQYWSSPFQVSLALIFLFNTLGLSAIPGVIIMIIFVPLSIFSSVLARRFMNEQMTLKDQRTKMINEILNGIKVIKLYAWEVPMLETIERIRKKELLCIIKAGLIRVVLDTFNFASPFLVALGSFATYTAISEDNVLTPEIAFVSLTLFNQLRSPMTMVGLLINMTVSAVVSNKRIKDLLTAEEVDEHAVERSDSSKPGEDTIKVQNADFSWEVTNPGAETNLSDINLSVKKGQLIAVVGKVGSGKSSLISALLGEMEKLRGAVGVHGQVAYVPQQAWIQNMSLQENITFGRNFSKYYYTRVVEACALTSDLNMLPQGGSTEIGEKGINLSGGQKARVSLARAVYQNSDVYLLDDPLSAVDSHVGKHIFDKVIGPNGLLRNKTRILVTHGVTFLKDADLIVHIENGQIAQMGTYAELLAQDGHLSEFINEFRKGHGSSSNLSSASTDSEEQKTSRTAKELGDFDDSNLSIMEDEDLSSENALTRQMSTLSALFKRAHLKKSSQISVHRTSESEVNEETEKLITNENLETGRVKMIVYWIYVKAASIFMSSLFVGLFVVYSALQLGRSLWLSAWSDENEHHMKHPEDPAMPLSVRLGVYATFGGVESIAFAVSLVCLLYGGLRASRRLHNPVLERILHAPMAFFDTTPIGRILNRFGKDIDVCDMMLPMSFRYFLMTISQIVTTIIAISITTPIFIAVAIPLFFVYLYALKFYVPTSRQLKRLESINRSPIYSHFGESIQGAVTIRAFGKADEFIVVNNELIDTFTRIRNLSFVANRWLGIRLELIGNLVTLSAALFAALSQQFGFISSAGLVGVSVSYALNITEVLNFAVRQISELETNIVSVERLKEYTEIEVEAPWTIDSNRTPEGWPPQGKVTFNNYSTRYRKGLDLVVKRINADVTSGQKIGIVGRTGAGKSSLTLALFRMIEAAEGSIHIDDKDISKIGLHDLRSNITIIPQDPVLFSGTLRFNLDPFDRYSDDQLWRALELAHLKAFANALADGLEHKITEGGENISVGQRQLVCLARALLRRSKILVLDEATAAVDMSTDALIQETIRKEFAGSTVLTIAHRLNTIMDYDRVLVLDQGEVREFDSPQALLSDKNSIFAAMAADANLAAA